MHQSVLVSVTSICTIYQCTYKQDDCPLSFVYIKNVHSIFCYQLLNIKHYF